MAEQLGIGGEFQLVLCIGDGVEFQPALGVEDPAIEFDAFSMCGGRFQFPAARSSRPVRP